MSISITEIESVKKPSKQKTPGPDEFHGEFYQTLWKNYRNSTLSEGRGRGNTSNHTYEASITPMPRPDKDI